MYKLVIMKFLKYWLYYEFNFCIGFKKIEVNDFCFNFVLINEILF